MNIIDWACHPVDHLQGVVRRFCKRGAIGFVLFYADKYSPFATAERWRRKRLAAALANNPRRDVVTVLAFLFYDYHGDHYMYGGAERYLVELCRICHGLGLKYEIIQAGDRDWTVVHRTDFGDIPVRAMKCPNDSVAVSREYARRYDSNSRLTIYSPFLIAREVYRPNSIGISHGVFWDTTGHREDVEYWRRELSESIGNCDAVVSVDTATLTWIRTCFLGRSPVMRYIPNFVDPDAFHPDAGKRREGRTTVLYPRRLYAPRGFDLALKLAERLIDSYRDVDMLFVGDANATDAGRMTEFVRRHPNRVMWRTVNPEDMPAVYQESDIAIIPTLHSEGTSLSCLEAMASECAVVATNIGGLSDLVQNNFSGKLISPDLDELTQAVAALIEDRAERVRLAKRGREVALAFSLAAWQDSWRRLISQFVCQ